MVQRFMRPIINPVRAAADLFRPLFGGEDTRQFARVSPVAVRRRVYDLNFQMYANTVYNRILDKGSLDFVKETLGESASNDLVGVFNPVERAVELYADNVFGRWGRTLTVAETVGSNRQERAVNDSILDPLDQIARWSNFDTELPDYARKCALFGTVGVRVVARVGKGYPNDSIDDRRVYLEFEHPSLIESVIEDERSNVQQIVTTAMKLDGDLSLDDAVNSASRVRPVLERTLMTKTEFAVRRGESSFDFVAGMLGGTTDRRPNVLGVTPYVLARHRKLGGTWGAWCFYGKEPMIHKANALAAHIDRQIIRHVNVTTVVAAKGQPPKEYDFSGRRLVHIELTEGATPPAFEHLVSNLSLADAISKLKLNIAELGNALPELKALDGDYLSGQSGETVAQLTKPAAAKIFGARITYGDTLTRALHMALSWGILLGIFRIKMLDGSNIPATKEACDLAYRQGAYDFEFEEYPALPQTEGERLSEEQLRLQNDEMRLMVGVREAATLDEADNPDDVTTLPNDPTSLLEGGGATATGTTGNAPPSQAPKPPPANARSLARIAPRANPVNQVG